MAIQINTKIPGPESAKILKALEKKNGGWGVPYPFVHAHGKGRGVYCEDIDGNRFLDFASQIASNPLGYNHPALIDVAKMLGRSAPVKYAGQDFAVEDHLGLIEELLSVSPRRMNAAFLVNSGAEAVENATKIAMYRRPHKQFSVSVSGAFHGRTLGALSLHHSKKLHRDGFMKVANKEIPFSDDAGSRLKEIVQRHGAEKIAFVILEHLQGEGGYRIPTKKMVKGIYNVCRKYKLPYVADEVQAGMGRTGKWWAFEHYGVVPDVFSSAKALQVGACVASRKLFPGKPGAISSTWGGGSVIDMALGIRTIEVIKHDRLLLHIKKMGAYILDRLKELAGSSKLSGSVRNIRGRGLMIAFDLPTSELRDNVIIACMKRGLLLLGAGERSIRVIPPYIIEEREIDEGMRVLSQAIRECGAENFRHRGHICNFMGCGVTPS